MLPARKLRVLILTSPYGKDILIVRGKVEKSPVLIILNCCSKENSRLVSCVTGHKELSKDQYNLLYVYFYAKMSRHLLITELGNQEHYNPCLKETYPQDTFLERHIISLVLRNTKQHLSTMIKILYSEIANKNTKMQKNMASDFLNHGWIKVSSPG